MSRLLSGSLSALAMIGFAPAAPAADDIPKEIVAKAVKAHGGAEFLARNKSVQSTEKGKLNVPGVGEVEFTEEAVYLLPDKFRHTIEFDAMNVKVRFVALIIGDKVSVDATANGQVADLGTNLKEAYKDVPHVLRVAHLAPLATDKTYELSLIGEDTVEEKKVVGVRVTKKGQKDVSVYFDKETGLIAKMEYLTVDSSNGKEVSEERIIREYGKDKDGIPYPKKTLIKQDGKTFLESETVEIKRLESIDESEFKK